MCGAVAPCPYVVGGPPFPVSGLPRFHGDVDGPNWSKDIETLCAVMTRAIEKGRFAGFDLKETRIIDNQELKRTSICFFSIFHFPFSTSSCL